MKKKTTVPARQPAGQLARQPAGQTVPQLAGQPAGQILPATVPDIPEIQVELNAHMPWLQKETDQYLDRLARSAREGKNLMEAANYCRWLQWSGIFAILDKCLLPENTHGAALREKNRMVIMECGKHFRGGKIDPTYAPSDISEINRKLDLLIGSRQKASVVSPSAKAKRLQAGGRA